MMNKEQLKQLSNWAGFVGIMMIIGGALYAITIVGIIPGIIFIILGLKLRNAKNHADELIASEEGAMPFEKVNSLVSELAIYFKIQGIMMIVAIALSIIGFILFIVLGMYAATQLGDFFTY